MLGSKIHSHYKIVKFLGVGKFGETYLAEDEDLPGNPPCIIKRFRYEGSTGITPLTEKLFEVQTEILYKLGEHPRVPELIGKFSDGNDLFLVQEYIEGTTLNELITPEKTWSMRSVINLLVDLLNTLKFFHDNFYIHQDIKPQNIIKRKIDDRYVLIGLGSIKDVKSLWQNIPDKNNVFVAVGSPGYISFEQEYGNPQFNSDIYSLGIIAIQALTGIFPLPRDPDTQVIQWRDHVKINFRFADILDKMVKPDYRNRYQSVDEVLVDIRDFAQTQIKQSPQEQMKPHFIFGASILGVILSLGILVKSNSKSMDQSPIIVGENKSVTDPSPSVIKPEGSLETYTSDRHKFELKYAPTWEVKTNDNQGNGEKVAFLIPKENPQTKFQQRVIISTANGSESVSLSRYTQQQIQTIEKNIPNAKIHELTDANLGEHFAQLVTYTSGEDRSSPIKTLQIWTVVNQNIYMITYRAEPNRYYRYLQEVMTLINSFQITE